MRHNTRPATSRRREVSNHGWKKTRSAGVSDKALEAFTLGYRCGQGDAETAKREAWWNGFSQGLVEGAGIADAPPVPEPEPCLFPSSLSHGRRRRRS